MIVANIVHWCTGVVAGCIRWVNINQVSFVGTAVRKRRRGWGWLFIVPGNVVLACRQTPVHVLFTTAWLRREAELNQVLYGRTIPPGRVFVCEKFPGVPLATWLQQPELTAAQKFDALKIAVAGLHRLHCMEVDDGNGATVRFSHGDASTCNVLYDREHKSACWFDFDLSHWQNIPARCRHADDLRAFLFSAMQHFPQHQLTELLSVIQQHYDAPEVWQTLREQVASRWFPFDVFHRAQIRRSGNDPAGLAPKHALLRKLICQTRETSL